MLMVHLSDRRGVSHPTAVKGGSRGSGALRLKRSFVTDAVHPTCLVLYEVGPFQNQKKKQIYYISQQHTQHTRLRAGDGGSG